MFPQARFRRVPTEGISSHAFSPARSSTLSHHVDAVRGMDAVYSFNLAIGPVQRIPLSFLQFGPFCEHPYGMYPDASSSRFAHSGSAINAKEAKSG